MKKKILWIIALGLTAFLISGCSDGHSHTYTDEVTLPTCEEKGFTTHTCSCGSVVVDSYIDALGHDVETWSSAKTGVSCEEESFYGICKTCGEEQMKIGDEHKLEGGVCTVCQADMFLLEFELSEDGQSYVVAGIGDCLKTDIVIPSEYQGKPVTAIDALAFYSSVDITSVVIPEGLTTIGRSAFSYCTRLKEIEISDTVEIIGNGAFSLCVSLKSVILPSNLSIVESSLFYGCYSLTSVVIPDGVTEIQRNAFGSCTYLTDIDIPNSVTSLGGSVFNACASLTSVQIPSGVLGIGDSTFYNCVSLESVVIPDGLLWIGNYAFYNCKALQSVVFPDGLLWIGNYAFYNCKVLTNAVIPNGVTELGSAVFQNCSKLPYNVKNNLKYYGNEENLYFYLVGVVDVSVTQITIESSCKFIASYAFKGCTALESVVIPEGVTMIVDYTFKGCVSLTSITLPKSVQGFCMSAFSGCTSLSVVYYPGTQEEWISLFQSGIWIYLILDCPDAVIRCTDGDLTA